MSPRAPASGRPGGPESRPLVDLPASDQDAERAVLGGVLLSGQPKTVFALANRKLDPESFYREDYGAVFAAMLSLAKRQEGIDPLTVSIEMERLGTVARFSRLQLDELAGHVPASGHLSAYADRVVEKARWRARRRVAYKMIEVIEKCDANGWEEVVALFAPPPATNGNGNGNGNGGPRTLRVVDEDGQVVAEEQHCDGCRDLQDQLDGATKEIAGWRARYAKLSRDKEAEARADGMWQTAQRLFEFWKKKTNHKRSSFTADRFYEVVPYLRNPKYGPDMVERAICGIAYDPFIVTRKNGTKKRFDEWSRVFDKADKFEEYVNKAPLDWKSELHLPKVGPQVAATPTQTKLIAVDGGA